MDPIDFEPISASLQAELHAECLRNLRSTDAKRIFDAVQALRWFPEDDLLLEALVDLLSASTPVLRGLGLEGLSALEHAESTGAIIEHIEQHRRDAAEAARAISVLGAVGTDSSIPFLERVIWDDSAFSTEAKEHAVEALLALATKGMEDARHLLETAHLSTDLDDLLVSAARAALRELGQRDWDDKGFATIDARLEPSD
jgi:hypothetical protein